MLASSICLVIFNHVSPFSYFGNVSRFWKIFYDVSLKIFSNRGDFPLKASLLAVDWIFPSMAVATEFAFGEFP